MSFREKSAWISLVAILVIFLPYFWRVAQVLQGDARFPFEFAVAFLMAFVLVEIAAHIVVALQAPKDVRAPKDERERLIEMRATRVAFHVLVVGALAGVGTMHLTQSVWVMSQAVLLAIVLAELVKFGGQILYYRRGV
jgi:hypothetical protein